MKKIFIGAFIALIVLGMTGCVTIGDSNTNSNNDNRIDNSATGSSNTSAGNLYAEINATSLVCTQNLTGVSIESGTYNMQKLEYGSITSVQNQQQSSGTTVVNFLLTAADIGKELSCGSEFRLIDGTTKTYRSNTLIY